MWVAQVRKKNSKIREASDIFQSLKVPSDMLEASGEVSEIIPLCHRA